MIHTGTIKAWIDQLDAYCSAAERARFRFSHFPAFHKMDSYISPTVRLLVHTCMFLLSCNHCNNQIRIYSAMPLSCRGCMQRLLCCHRVYSSFLPFCEIGSINCIGYCPHWNGQNHNNNAQNHRAVCNSVK